jgi:hypothetical protein
MAGGFLRFQAQYLRRIRIPRWEDVPRSLRQALARNAENPNLDELDVPVFQLYGLGAQEADTVRAAAAAARVRPAPGYAKVPSQCWRPPGNQASLQGT